MVGIDDKDREQLCRQGLATVAIAMAADAAPMAVRIVMALRPIEDSALKDLRGEAATVVYSNSDDHLRECCADATNRTLDIGTL